MSFENINRQFSFMSKKRVAQTLILVASLGCYILLGYFTKRSDFIWIVCLYSSLFVFYLYILHNKYFSNSFRIAFISAIVFRLSLLLMTPNLTDDYFRYVWDGLLFTGGENPYLVTPAEYVNSTTVVSGVDISLYERLNSPYYYSAYPPFSQLIFGLSVKISGHDIFTNLLILRGIFILAEIGSMFVLYKLSVLFGRSPKVMLFYALNPLVIMELIGNLHLEALMIFFFLLAMYLLLKEKHGLSAICFGLAVGTKLIPLIFLPLILKSIGIRRSIKYLITTGIIVIILIFPFFNLEAISNYLESLRLYFEAFEFNASIYYLLKLLYGLSDTGNIIPIIHIMLPIITLLVVSVITWKTDTSRSDNLMNGMLLCITAFYLLSTNIHPWNLTPLIMLSVFSRYRYMLSWSAGIVLSYFAYRTFPFSENIWLISIEYLVLGGHMGYEFQRSLKSR